MENISTTSKPLGTEGEGDKTNIVAIIVPVGFVFIVGMVVAVILCRKYRRCGVSMPNAILYLIFKNTKCKEK